MIRCRGFAGALAAAAAVFLPDLPATTRVGEAVLALALGAVHHDEVGVGHLGGDDQPIGGREAVATSAERVGMIMSALCHVLEQLTQSYVCELIRLTF